MLESDVILSLTRKTRVDFPRIGANKLRIYLQPKFEMMGIETSWDDALSYVEKIINLYNNERPHQSISFLPPEAVHQSGIHTERKWKNYYAKKEIQPDLSIVPQVKSLQAMDNNLSSHVGNVDFES